MHSKCSRSNDPLDFPQDPSLRELLPEITEGSDVSRRHDRRYPIEGAIGEIEFCETDPDTQRQQLCSASVIARDVSLRGVGFTVAGNKLHVGQRVVLSFWTTEGGIKHATAIVRFSQRDGDTFRCGAQFENPGELVYAIHQLTNRNG